MSIAKGYKLNFETMLAAAKVSGLALLECTDKVTGKPVMAIVMCQRCGTDTIFTPVAKLFDGNPYEELDPPA